jgi:predicted nucleotide-binding protein
MKRQTCKFKINIKNSRTMSEKKKLRKKSSKKYPKLSLLKSLEIAQSIIDNNAGKPYNRLSLAKSLNQSPGSSKFRTQIIASGKFGLTKGGYNAPKISINPLADSILRPKSEEERKNGLKKALFNISFYKAIFEMYDNNSLPKKQLFKNTLQREFEIPQDATDQCYNLIMENAKDLEILQEISGNLWINLDELSVSEDISEDISEIPEDISKDKKEDIVYAEKAEKKIKKITSEVELKKELKPKAFIAHSKNDKILEQLKEILDFGQFEYIIAEEVETAAIPIPEKIFGLMKKCNCAIINISADEQEKLPDDSYKINENVLIEIGASFLNYDKKVILLVDKRIILPSNLQGLYKCEYEGDELPFSLFGKLSKALKGFRN